jgi:urease subunit alpha
MYGPTVGDRVRLGDTNLLVEVEHDDASSGDETLWGFGNPDRDGKLPVTSAQPGVRSTQASTLSAVT